MALAQCHQGQAGEDWDGRVINELLTPFLDVLVDACEIKIICHLFVLFKSHLKQGISILNILCL